MGMFDEVQTPHMRCPTCGGNLNFQSKDGECGLLKVTVADLMEQTERIDRRGSRVVHMLGDCDDCQYVIEVEIANWHWNAPKDAA